MDEEEKGRRKQKRRRRKSRGPHHGFNLEASCGRWGKPEDRIKGHQPCQNSIPKTRVDPLRTLTNLEAQKVN